MAGETIHEMTLDELLKPAGTLLPSFRNGKCIGISIVLNGTRYWVDAKIVNSSMRNDEYTLFAALTIRREGHEGR
jgi:hypothetical protein